jgi:hypothetical protein
MISGKDIIAYALNGSSQVLSFKTWMRVKAQLRQFQTSFKQEIVYASDCPPCSCCEEPFCQNCNDHYADCSCPGPNSMCSKCDTEFELCPCIKYVPGDDT